MDLEGLKQSKVIQKEKDKYCVVLLISGILKNSDTGNITGYKRGRGLGDRWVVIGMKGHRW